MSNLHKEIADIVLEAVNMDHLELSEADYQKPLNAEPFEFDSIDFLEAVVAVEEEYKVKLESPAQAPEHFKTIDTIVNFVTSKQNA